MESDTVVAGGPSGSVFGPPVGPKEGRYRWTGSRKNTGPMRRETRRRTDRKLHLLGRLSTRGECCYGRGKGLGVPGRTGPTGELWCRLRSTQNPRGVTRGRDGSHGNHILDPTDERGVGFREETGSGSPRLTVTSESVVTTHEGPPHVEEGSRGRGQA